MEKNLKTKSDEIELNENQLLKLRNITIDKEKKQVTLTSRILTLPRNEFEILCFLASQPEKIITRDEIYQHVWGNEVVGLRNVDMHIRKLREKLGKNHIETITKLGYKFME